jgi:hypothetical protein
MDRGIIGVEQTLRHWYSIDWFRERAMQLVGVVVSAFQSTVVR